MCPSDLVEQSNHNPKLKGSDPAVTDSEKIAEREGKIRRYDTQHNDIQPTDTQHNDTQHNDTQHNDTQHNDSQHNDTQHNI